MMTGGENTSFAEARVSSIAVTMKIWENGTGSDQWGALELERADGERLVCTALEKVSHDRDISAEGRVPKDVQCFTYHSDNPQKRTPFDLASMGGAEGLRRQLERFAEDAMTMVSGPALRDQKARFEARLVPLVRPFFTSDRKPTEEEIDAIVAATLDVFGTKAHCHTSAEPLTPIVGTQQAANLFDVNECRATYFKAKVGDIVLTGGWTAAVAEAPLLQLLVRANDPRLMDFVVKIGDVTITLVDLPPFSQIDQFVTKARQSAERRREQESREMLERLLRQLQERGLPPPGIEGNPNDDCIPQPEDNPLLQI